MKIKEKSLEELKEILKTEKEFHEIIKWKFKQILTGEMQHTYKISKRHKSYFLKELKPHETQMEYFLSKLKLKHLPFASYPNLLKEKVLVRKFIPGRMLRTKTIDLGLIKDYALMQNKMNDKKIFDKYNVLKLKNYSQKDNGFYGNKGRTYEKEFKNKFNYAKKALSKLDKYNLKEVRDFREILNYLNKDKKEIIKDYVNMPFAKHHNDFREENIIVGNDSKQILIDWGSSYSYDPFMTDLAPFLINNKKALQEYIKNSNICKNATKKQIERWLYVSLASRFLGIIRYRLNPDDERANTKKNCRKYLSYEYKTYKNLLK